MCETAALILVVDDQEDSRNLLVRRLAKQGYSVTQAQDGEQALSLIATQPFNLILLDIMMPDVDGMEVLKRVRRTHSRTELPVIMVTAKRDSNDVVEALALGANDYVSKPVDYPVLLARIDVQMARKRAEDALVKLNLELEQKVGMRTIELEKSLGLLKEEVAQRKLAEQAIKAREEKFKDFSEVASDWFWETDGEHRLSFVSELFGEKLGILPEEAIGKTVCGLMGGDPAQERFWGNFRSKLNAHLQFRDYQYTLTDSDGRSHHMRVSGKPIFDNAGVFQGYRGTGKDETEAVVVRERIRAAENQLVGITKNLRGVVFRRVLKVDGAVEYPFVSGGTDKLIGLPQEDVFAGGFLALQAIYGSDVDCVQEAINRSAQELMPVDIDYRIVLSENEIKWVHCSAHPYRSDSGDTVWDGLLLDISERKDMEAQLVQAQKLESIGQLAAGIAHEINTPTQFVSDNIRFLQEAFVDLGTVLKAYAHLLEAAQANSVTPDMITEVEDAMEKADLEYLNDEVPKAVEQAIEGVQRIIIIVSAMKQFSHPGGDEKETVDLNQIIENTITVARNEWKYVAHMERNFSTDLPPVPCYRDKLSQVFLNLIVNAAQAIGGQERNGSDSLGTITITTRRINNEVEIQVCDTGPGVPESLHAQIFNPFFTTKEVGKGTGQGLAIARSVVVDKHGGDLKLESERGTGAAFVIRLPLLDEQGVSG